MKASLKLISSVILLVVPISVKAQVNSNLQITGGLTTMWIVNNNVARESIVPRLDDEVQIPGAGFDGQQLGVSARLMYGLDSKNKFRFITGLDYYFLRGVQRNQLTSRSIFFTYAVDMPTIILGAEYAFLEYPPGNVRVYTGLETRGAFTSAKPIDFRVVRFGDNTVLQTGRGEIKEDAFRIGGAVRLGIDGELFDPWYVNFSVAYGVVNLIGRDHTRGELLTPDHSGADLPYPDFHEGYIHNLLTSFLLQYRF